MKLFKFSRLGCLALAGTLLYSGASQAASLLVRNAQIFDGHSEQLSAPSDLLVVDGIIERIGKGLTAPAGASEIDAAGRTLMPGMINAHAHVMLQLPVMQALTSDDYYYAYTATVAAELFLDNGFTTIRDMSGNTFSLKKAIDRGVVPGPRIFPSGAMISQTSGHADHRTDDASSRLLEPASRSTLERRGMTIVADGEGEVLQAVRENLRRGATQIKISVGGGISSYGDPLDVTQYTATEIRAAVTAAADWGTYVAAHVYNSDGVRRAVELGVRSIEHANLIDRATLEYMRDNDVWLSPQVMVFQQELVGMNADQRAKQAQARDGVDNLMSAVRDSGFENIVFGADIVTSLATVAKVNEELQLRTRWFSPVEILRQATSKAGELLSLSGPRNPYGKLGVIEPGAVADMLIVDGNPLRDIAVLTSPKQNIKVIVKGGEVYKNTLDD